MRLDAAEGSINTLWNEPGFANDTDAPSGGIQRFGSNVTLHAFGVRDILARAHRLSGR